MKIVFFGAGDFAFPIAKRIAQDFTLLAVVVTRPRPRGRGRKVKYPEIAQWAQDRGITLLTPPNPNDQDFIDTITGLAPDLYVLSAYGHILSGALLKVPKYGGINIHPSFLPQYRGAAPIQRALMTGETTTGVTVIFMDEKVDHGEMIFREEVAIEPHDDYSSLSERLSTVATGVISQVIQSVASRTYTSITQDDTRATYAPKIKKEEVIIDWHRATTEILNQIRALSPKPCARTRFRERELKIIGALPGGKMVTPGTFHIEKKTLYTGTGDGSVIITKVQPENRSVISGLDFINGFHIQEGEAVG